MTTYYEEVRGILTVGKDLEQKEESPTGKCPTCKYKLPGHSTSCPVLRHERLKEEKE